jgi:hypothetical protein
MKVSATFNASFFATHVLSGRRKAADLILQRPTDVKEFQWTSRAVARALGFPDALVAMFSDKKTNPQQPQAPASEHIGSSSSNSNNNVPRNSATPEPAARSSNFVDRMEVDYRLIIDPKDALHLDIIERLGEYLRDLIDQVMDEEVRERIGSESAREELYAVRWKKIKFEEWTLADCVQYLGPAPGLGWLTAAQSDALTTFLTPRSASSGYRTPKGKAGSTWTTVQWRNAMADLERVGQRAEERWENRALNGYLEQIRDEAREFNLGL